MTASHHKVHRVEVVPTDRRFLVTQRVVANCLFAPKLFASQLFAPQSWRGGSMHRLQKNAHTTPRGLSRLRCVGRVADFEIKWFV